MGTPQRRAPVKVALKRVDPNPFRRLDVYPVAPEKVKALKESIGATVEGGAPLEGEKLSSGKCSGVSYYSH